MIEISANKPVYTIGKAAELLGVSVHTLRMYEREGLILPHRSENGRRFYSADDLTRIQCIRDSISNSKISINGIKSIYAMIPCWEVIDCPKESRENCEAYQGHSEPCWSYPHPKTICEKIDCRECEVYQTISTCKKVKELIKKYTG